MKINKIITIILFVALLTIGVLSGFFFAYSHNIVFALDSLSYRDFIVIMSLLNQNVRNVYFAFFFFGSHIISLFLIIYFLIIRKPFRSYYTYFIIGALIELIGILFVTVKFNLPINIQVELLNPSILVSDWELLRSQWKFYNDIRTLSGIITFLLYLFGFYFFIQSYDEKQ